MGIHTDPADALDGVTAVVPMGSFTGGDIDVHEIHPKRTITMEVPEGSVAFFNSRLSHQAGVFPSFLVRNVVLLLLFSSIRSKAHGAAWFL